MDSEKKAATLTLFIITNSLLFVFFFMGLYFGYQRYFQFPKAQQQTQCQVIETNAMKWTFGKFQVIWTIGYNDNESEKLSKIFVSNYTTFTDAVEATTNQYKIGQIYKCYFNQKKPYDLLWTIDDKVDQGKRNLITAFICGILILIVWTIPLGYFCHKWYKNTIVNSRKL